MYNFGEVPPNAVDKAAEKRYTLTRQSRSNRFSPGGKASAGSHTQVAVRPVWGSGAYASVFFFEQINGGCVFINDLMINEEIRDREVRVVNSQGEQLGIMPTAQALKLAEEMQLDLVNIAPAAHPPVCKLMDYGKYRFEMSKKEREIKKNQKVIETKEVRLSATIEDHDIDVRYRQAIKFLQDGNKLKVTIRFRGRQIAHSEIGTDVMDEFAERIRDYGVVERRPMVEGRNMTMMVAPRDPKKD